MHYLADTSAWHIAAATAESAGAVLWHYDEDYDRIAETTGQAVEWIAPRGSL